MSEKDLLEDILAAQVLTLAKALKAEKATKDVQSTGDFIYEACREIQSQKRRIFDNLQHTT